MNKSEAFQALREFIGNKRVSPRTCPFVFWDEFDSSESGSLPFPLQPPAQSSAIATADPVSFVELLAKANNLDSAALSRLVTYLRALCNELEILTRKHPTFVKQIASTFYDWPVLYSLNGARVCEVRQLLCTLDIGRQAAPLPTNSSQKYDPRNLWTRYALNAIECLRINQNVVPELLPKCELAKRRFNAPIRIFGTVHETTFYDVGDEIIAIADWQRKCTALPARLTKGNAPEFMALAKFAIREFWLDHPEHYSAMKRAMKSKVLLQDRESVFIDRAFQRISQAMKGLAHKK